MSVYLSVQVITSLNGKTWLNINLSDDFLSERARHCWLYFDK